MKKVVVTASILLVVVVVTKFYSLVLPKEGERKMKKSCSDSQYSAGGCGGL